MDRTIVHPILMAARARTALWFEQRKQCLKCGHYVGYETRADSKGHKSLSMHCTAVVQNKTRKHARSFPACLDVRDGGTCGPEAKHWVAA